MLVDGWIDRRQVLESNGVAVPRLIGYATGVFLEEFIATSLRKVIEDKSQNLETLLQKLVWFAAKLRQLGFRPINAFSDLRLQDGALVVVDFGEDLGPPGLHGGETSRLFHFPVLNIAIGGFSSLL